MPYPNMSQYSIIVSWKVAIAIGASVPILTILMGYLANRFTRMFDSYAGERAKLQAQFDNLELLVRQTGRLTETSESIKAAVTGEQWANQQRWQKRLDLYGDVVGILHNFRQASFELTTQLESSLLHTDESAGAAQIGASLGALKERLLTFRHIYNLVTLVGSTVTVKSLYQLTELSLGQDPLQTARELTRIITEIEAEFLKAARSDLGYEAIRTLPVQEL